VFLVVFNPPPNHQSCIKYKSSHGGSHNSQDISHWVRSTRLSKMKSIFHKFSLIFSYKNKSFHHKKGWQSDVSYPDTELETEMEHLPTLCLPDQSHNFESDSVYFVVPNKKQNEKKIFGMKGRFDEVSHY
jgi:Transport protein Avl9